MCSEWDLRLAMLPVGTVYFYQVHARRIVLPKWLFRRISLTLYFTAFQSFRRHASTKLLA